MVLLLLTIKTLPLRVLGEDICNNFVCFLPFVLAVLKWCSTYHSNAVVRNRNNLMLVFDIFNSISSQLIVLNGFLKCLTFCSWAFGFSSPSEFVKKCFSPISNDISLQFVLLYLDCPFISCPFLFFLDGLWQPLVIYFISVRCSVFDWCLFWDLFWFWCLFWLRS